MSDPAARLAYEHARALAARDAAHRALTERLLLRCADALDSFDRLLADGAASDVDTYRGSLALIAGQLERDLAEEGLERVGHVGERAEPATHHVEAVRAAPPGADGDEVLEILQRGYRYRGQVLRAARVVVAVDGGTEQGTVRE
ncbi:MULTISPECIES: nucleotide exchange factor GrpE [Streptomyces]|uniref:Nucleotide exchange factor GrpE n=1 Tax=Streptomyces venezuelae TaxID=54571 RepID=A0A5P2BJE8_STRVZ|nr:MULTISPECIES: nucleotide exchange factor GrpE [Streptomyces]MYY80727.1 nucleotide exchange factor GrpE [Streptomyces sp. SID335]MYZ18741.1 nucleotide exchange factor GrpE [Streptomyces sp. SID337]NDZ89585.1 nucleotide exchange factor GrpE [Streptomyces sp. SID10115]NEB48654.1 nucleotide exchange factor GrpE [Streptomyces sp. SID339]QES30130.1 nucleotide exchange factor GrpE [Streptomyces venezuelae]